MHPDTRQNLIAALEGEAISAARMIAYADRSVRDDDHEAAQVLRAIARMSMQHATEILELLGWVGSLKDNVLASVVGDATTHGLNYAALAAAARRSGDRDVADLFRRLTADETEAAIGLLAIASRDPSGAGRLTGARTGPLQEHRAVAPHAQILRTAPTRAA